MEIQKIFSNIEDPEETLYSVLMSEDEITLFSEVKEKEEKKGNKLGTAGKVALGAGAATSLASGVVSNKIGNDVMKKVASKTGVEKLGWGLGSSYHNFGPNAQAKVDRASELTKRALKQNKGFKKALKADTIGTGVALTGAGLMAANHFLNKNKKKKDNE